MYRNDDRMNSEYLTGSRGRTSGYRPNIKRLLIPKLEDISRLLYLNQSSLTEGDRVWVKERIDQMFDVRLRK